MNLTSAHMGRTILATGAVALLAAACGSNGGGSNSSGTSDTGSSSGALVSVSSVDGTKVLTDADGHTLYSAAVEKGGNIRCVDSCTSFWAPLMASAAAVKAAGGQVADDLGTVNRPDGQSQLTYDGMPLYTFTSEGADELKGNGFTDDFQGTHFVWSAATTDESAETSGGSDDGYGSGGGGASNSDNGSSGNGYGY